MTTALFVFSGAIGLITSLAHGYLGETLLLSRAQVDSEMGRRALKAVFHLSTVYWLICGVVLMLIPFWLVSPAGYVLALVVAVIYMIGAIGNFWLSRGRHIGWVLLSLASALAVLGAVAM